MILSLLSKHIRCDNDSSEFYMNEYECIDKVLFDPKVFFVLQDQDEKACEIGVNFNLEQIFQKAEQLSREEEGFKAIIKILDGKFGVQNEEEEENENLHYDDEIAKENQYDMQLQQLAIEYLKSNIIRKSKYEETQEQRSSNVLTPEMANNYMEKLKTISNTMESNPMILAQEMNFSDGKFDNGDHGLPIKSDMQESIQLETMQAPENGEKMFNLFLNSFLF